MKISKIRDVVLNDLCIGCGICTNFSETSSVDYDKNGFLVAQNYNHRRTDITEENLVKNICPGIKTYSKESKVDYIWGDFKSIKLSYSTDEKIRYNGSSGGTITQILVYLLEKNIVDYVIHIQEDSNNVLGNKVVITNNIDSVKENTGSKYCPSSPIKDIINKIDLNKKYAFVGRPCDIVAISNYQKLNKELSDSILYKISFFCAGVPSIKGTDKILEKFNLDSSDINSFRYRGNGWPGYTTAEDKNGEKYKLSYNDSWGKILNRYLHPRCKICPDGVGISADIVFGDGWDCDEKGYPVFKENDGKSLMIIRSEIGVKLIGMLKKDNKITLEEFNYENLKMVQPYQYNRRITINSRINAMKLFNRNVPNYDKSVFYASKNQSNKLKIKTFIGTVKRIIKKRI